MNNTVGLSILIPVYNYDITSLVRVLAAQLTRTGKKGEIILLDDGSDNTIISGNPSLQTIPLVSYHQHQKNEGRMASRQKLAGLARYAHLLFLDCDSVISKDDFLAAYFELVEQNVDLASGGRIYPAVAPAECELRLHWKYGTKRENMKTGRVPGKGPAFMSNNFLVKRELFDQLDNSLQLPGYGHEDSWWGIQFEQAGVRCVHIYNPVLHGALEKATIFLTKTEQALDNLLLLEKKAGKLLVSRHVRIFRWYGRVKRSGLSRLYLFIEKRFHNYFRENLLSCRPRLLFFDCYRLAVLIRMARAKSTV
ncbi:MAG: glycosyltransferase family 2 protein [Ferruginibacter sp.]|nr:glycosyltransferase family 2 protein [Chitinophagaceae bacterium]